MGITANDVSKDMDLEPVVSSAMVEIEKSRAVQEVQGMMILAQRFPRDINKAYINIMKSCERVGLAEQAIYSYPKGGAIVTGPSIRLAEVLAQNWRNLDFGIREIERKVGSSTAESFCWDIETNTRQSKIFEVPHEIGLKGGKKKILTDPRDIYELVANSGARRLRACILGIIPIDISDAAAEQCRKTLEGDNKMTVPERIREMVLAFDKLGISSEMIEKRLGHKMDLTVAKEIVDLKGIYASIRDKHIDRSEFFDVPRERDEATTQDAKSADLSAKLKAAQTPKSNDPSAFDNFQG